MQVDDLHTSLRFVKVKVSRGNAILMHCKKVCLSDCIYKNKLLYVENNEGTADVNVWRIYIWLCCLYRLSCEHILV